MPPCRQIAIPMNTNSALTGSFNKNFFQHQHFNRRQGRILSGGQLNKEIDAADVYHLIVTTRKTMSFQDDIPSIPIDTFKDHCVIVFQKTSMQGFLKIVNTPN